MEMRWVFIFKRTVIFNILILLHTHKKKNTKIDNHSAISRSFWTYPLKSDSSMNNSKSISLRNSASN